MRRARRSFPFPSASSPATRTRRTRRGPGRLRRTRRRCSASSKSPRAPLRSPSPGSTNFAAYMKFHKQGREFPVWEVEGVKFGAIICADGGYIEPARILAMKGARIIFAPHFNYIGDRGLIGHFMKVRADHAARAVENGVYFVRGNNVVLDPKKSGITRSAGVGYGDSYILD